MNIMDWATHEVELACKKENPNKKEGEWDYGCACYESALKAYKSLCEDGHSGFSFSATRMILDRLMNSLPLTPITDEDFFLPSNMPAESEEWLKRKGLKSDIQCPRMSSLFRYETLDGSIRYSDINRYYCYDRYNPNITWKNGFMLEQLDKMFPITMPYNPQVEKYKLECSDCLVDPKCGDFDTLALWSIITPDGEKIKVNKFWKESPSGWTEISFAEWLIRKNNERQRGQGSSSEEQVLLDNKT